MDIHILGIFFILVYNDNENKWKESNNNQETVRKGIYSSL